MKVKRINSYYFDTYALVEIGKGNPNYQKYKNNIKIVLNKLNIMEFCYYLLRENRKNEAKSFFKDLIKFHVDMPNIVFIKAIKMKYKYKERKLSYIDCLGYCMAKNLELKFLTGDEKFKDILNVEFVK